MTVSIGPGLKRLRSIAHSFAQHTLSGLSSNTPERNLDQRRAGVERIAMTIVGDAPGDGLLELDPFDLRERVIEIVGKEPVDPDFIAFARAVFLFKGQSRSPYCCDVIIATVDGRRIEAKSTE